MEKKSFYKIVEMIVSACNGNFNRGTSDLRPIVLECATKIYIAQMKGGEE